MPKQTKYNFPPEPGIYGAIRLTVIDGDEFEAIVRNKTFKKLAKQNRVSLYDNEMWVWEEDTRAIDALNTYFYGWDYNL